MNAGWDRLHQSASSKPHIFKDFDWMCGTTATDLCVGKSPAHAFDVWRTWCSISDRYPNVLLPDARRLRVENIGQKEGG